MLAFFSSFPWPELVWVAGAGVVWGVAAAAYAWGRLRDGRAVTAGVRAAGVVGLVGGAAVACGAPGIAVAGAVSLLVPLGVLGTVGGPAGDLAGGLLWAVATGTPLVLLKLVLGDALPLGLTAEPPAPPRIPPSGTLPPAVPPGTRGTAATALRPAGTVTIAGTPHPARSAGGGYVDAGAVVVVVNATGAGLVVKEPS